MSRVRANKLTNNAANGAPQLTFGAEVVAGVGLTGAGGINITGVVTAASFSGDGSGLSGVDSTALKDSGGSVKVQANTSGIMVTGVSTFTGNVSVGGTLTYEDVTNIDSVGIITAQQGIRVGAGQSVSAVSGTVTYYGDGSKLTGVESGVSNFVASGNIANGDTVVIKTDGTVGIVTGVSVTQSVGSPVVFESASGPGDYMASIYDSTTNKVVLAYMDGGNSNHGTAIVGTVSGTSISFGSPVVFEAATTTYIGMGYDSGNQRVVIGYQDGGNSDHGTVIVGTVSGTSISFGTANRFYAATSKWFDVVYDSGNQRVVVCFTEGNSNGRAVVGTVDPSNNSITFGSTQAFDGNQCEEISAVYDVAHGKTVIVYKDTGDSSHGKAVVGTVDPSNNSITFGSDVTFQNSAIFYNDTIYDSANEKIVIAYRDNNSSKHGTAIVGTVSGTSISFGTKVVFEAAETNFIGATYDSVNSKVIISYCDNGNSNYGTVISGTVSGTSISFDSPLVYESSYAKVNRIVYDTNSEKSVIAYGDNGNSDYGTAIVYTPGGSSTNLTTENYIGIAAEAIADGATGKVNIIGGVNSGQTGLTTAQTYYVQKTGSLATSADSPSVVAGTSISSTKILIR